ncbi:sentrin-specific protease 5 isoform X2 [Electrophorus electricus]|uniref:sentrin-specific protease 5 isoform X2 n=1 Tax=Electrophorus electricus TaxID=8005 RepID=UPI0015D08FCE|nr:sentrin-specific protease 5 isoform X2 [Electrophorus electricus]
MRVRVYNGSEQAESVPAEMSENGRSRRKRVPKQCDCCGPNGKGHATGHHQIAKKRGRRRAEPVSEVEVATDNHVSSAVVDLVSTPEPDEITVWEVQQAMLCDPTTTLSEAGPPASDSTALHNGIVVSREDSPEANRKDPMSLSDSKKPHSDTHASTTANGDRPETPAAPVTQSDCLGLDQMVDDNAMEVEHAIFPVYLNTKALWDHRYCKRGGHWEAVSTEELPDLSQSSSAEVQDDHIIELIHEFLENFYEKYGSFIPLIEEDILEYLNKHLNTDLKDRKKMISTEVMKYKSGLACAPMNFFKVTYNKHILALDDLATLDDQNWVNDQIINMYGELIMETTNHKIHFFNSFFYRQLVAKGYEGVKRWTKKVDLFSKRLLLVPVHLEIHWSLITVDVSKQNINFYDSQGILFKFAVDNILKYILAEAKEKKQTAFQKGWKMTVNKTIPQQKNDNDCGVFVLEYCKCLAFKEPLLFTQEDMPKVRKRIYKELCDCKLLDVPKPV